MDSDKTWSKILDYIKQNINSANFRTWFSQTKPASIDQTKLTILVPSAFIKDQLASRYQELILAATVEVLGKELEIAYQIDSSLFAKKGADSSSPDEEDSFFQTPITQNTPISPLNPKYSLENFVVGTTNNLAYAAAQAIVQNPGTSYNPLFIYGPSGVGKTHLMQAIGNALLSKNPNSKLVFASSERFMVDFVESLQTKRMGDFRQKYRNCDLLLLDDVQFFSGKESIQEEFFHTFNELQTKNSQLIFTSDRSPNEIAKLEDRLRSRLQGGLMVDIQLPDFETRMAILKAKLKEKGESLPDEILSQIAGSVTSNTRELEGKLIQIIQMSKSGGQDINSDSIQRFLGTPLPESKQQNLDYKKVLNTINNYFNIKMADLTGPRRQKELVLPRQIAMLIMYEQCRLPFERIGQLLGGRDHTTIMHGVEKMKDVSTRDREVQRLIIEIKNQITN